jgi:hypothetical protein
MQKNKITAILTLKDRNYYTKRWLHFNYSKDINYIIADGSRLKKNLFFFQKHKKKNITYIRFCPDKKLKNFVSKIYESIKLVKTEYLFFCDNDDFINLKTFKLTKIKSFPQCKFELFGYNLKILAEKSFQKGKRFLFSPCINQGNYKLFNNLSKKQRLLVCLNTYNHFWYNIYSKQAAMKLWKIIFKMKIKNPYALEIAHSLLAISLLSYKYLPIVHYARVINPKQSYAKSINKQSSVFSDAILNTSFQDDIQKLKKYIISHKICTEEEFNLGFKAYLLKQVQLSGILFRKMNFIKAELLKQLCFKKTVF